MFYFLAKQLLQINFQSCIIKYSINIGRFYSAADGLYIKIMERYSMELLKENERSANLSAARVMRITVVVFAAVVLLDIAGIFAVNLNTMLTAFGIGAVLLIIPTILVNAAKRGDSFVKYIIVLCAVFFTMIITITLSWHTVLFYVYPIAIASLYFSGKLNIFAAILTAIATSVGQLAAFYSGFIVDRNLETLDRVIIFGIVPRALSLFAVSAIFTMLCHRTAAMLGDLMGAEQQRLMREKSLDVSKRLLEAVDSLSRISSATAKANHRISGEAENVLRDSNQNSAYINAVEQNMEHIAENFISLSKMSGKITGLTSRAKQITDENNTIMLRAVDSMEGIHRGTDESRKIIAKLSEQSERIISIAKVITDISQQTNILSINAAVEASRAGAAGKSFAVVAHEIKRLSEQTNKATTEIDEIIEGVTGNIAATVAAMDKNALLTREGMESMEQVKRSAEYISDSNSEISQNVIEMNKIIGGVAQNGKEVSAKLVDVSNNIGGNCDAMRLVTAAIEENNTETEKLEETVGSIKELAAEMRLLSE